MTQLVVASPSYGVGDMERMARAIAVSKLFGVQNAEQALALCLVAQAEGRHPATAAQDYHILQGRPAKKADAMLRDFLGAGGKVQWHELSDKIADASFTHPAGGSARIDWTIDRAKRAGLTTPMWSKYPRQMLRARCVSEGVRTVFPMATSGMYVPEEVADFEPTTAAAPAPEPPVAVETVAITDQRDAAPAGIKRLTSARAKEIGLHDDIKAKVDALDTLAACDAFDERFDTITAQCPMSWLDSIRNMVLLKREELQSAPEADEANEYAAEFDRAFRGAVGEPERAPA